MIIFPRTLVFGAIVAAYAGTLLAQTSTASNGVASAVSASGPLTAPVPTSSQSRKAAKRKEAAGTHVVSGSDNSGSHFSSGSAHAMGFDNGSSTGSSNDTGTGIGVSSSGSSATGTGGGGNSGGP